MKVKINHTTAVKSVFLLLEYLAQERTVLFLTEPHHEHGHHLHKVMETWKKIRSRQATLEKEARPGGKSLDAKKSHNRTKEPGPW